MCRNVDYVKSYQIFIFNILFFSRLQKMRPPSQVCALTLAASDLQLARYRVNVSESLSGVQCECITVLSPM